MDTVYKLVFTENAKRQYDDLDSRLQPQIDKALARIARKPKVGKALSGELKGIWSERVATFRILYKIRGETVEVLVLLIEHRKTVYGGH